MPSQVSSTISKMHSVNIRAAREHVYWRQSESGLKGLRQDSGCLRHLNHNGAFKLSYSGAGENTTPALTRGRVALYQVTVGACGPSVALTRGSEREIERLCSERRIFFVRNASTGWSSRGGLYLLNRPQ